MRDCPQCLISHASKEEAQEIHQASANIRAWLRQRMLLVMRPIPKPEPVYRKPDRPNPPKLVKRRTA